MLAKEEYELYVKRPYPPFPSSMILTSWASEKQHQPFLPVPFAEKNNVFCEGDWYFCKEDVQKGISLIFQHWSNPAHFKTGKKLLQEREKVLLRSHRNFQQFCAAFEAYIPAMHFIWFCEKPVGEKVRMLLQEKISASETEELLDYLNRPLQDNFYKKEEFDLARCTNLARHVQKYRWLLSRYGDNRLYTEKEARSRKEKIPANFLEISHEEKRKINERCAYVRKIVGKKNSHFITWMQFIIFYRTHRTDVLNRSLFQAIPMLEKYAMTKGISYRELLHCTKEELISQIPSKEIIQERMKSFAMLTEDSKLRCVQGKEIQTIKNYLKEEIHQDTEIKGARACSGKIIGKVTVIHGVADFSKIKVGDVLVTSMTTPNMVPIMQKAAAFVTDEGGITCHAAIVAREMKKPCVIGTKIATKIFKDGDVVEVDATAGIVKKIQPCSPSWKRS